MYGSGARWITISALLSAVFAVCAAIAALQSGHHANEAMLDEYKAQQKEIEKEAKEKEEHSFAHFDLHRTFAKAVTFFQIAIAVVAIAVIARRKWFLWVAATFSAIGACFLAVGRLHG